MMQTLKSRATTQNKTSLHVGTTFKSKTRNSSKLQGGSLALKAATWSASLRNRFPMMQRLTLMIQLTNCLSLGLGVKVQVTSRVLNNRNQPRTYTSVWAQKTKAFTPKHAKRYRSCSLAFTPSTSNSLVSKAESFSWQSRKSWLGSHLTTVSRWAHRAR